MKVLFVHQAYPGPYRDLAPALAARGHDVLALTMAAQEDGGRGVRVIRYGAKYNRTTGIHPWAAEFETSILHGERVAFIAIKLRADGFMPDVICVHPGWGEALFLKDVWPAAHQLNYCDFYHKPHGADADFDPEYSLPGIGSDARARTRNACNLLSLEASDWGISPSQWQRSLFPKWAQPRISVVHDGIDTDLCRPVRRTPVWLPEAGLAFSHGCELVTFATRSLSARRGCHVFLRALRELLQLRPSVQVVILGEDNPDDASPHGSSWKEFFLEAAGDRANLLRVHFLGRVPHAILLQLLQVSAVHVHLSYPSMLSTSLLEAMSCGCLVVGSRTAPVEEVIDHGRNGLLVNFFDTSALARTIAAVLEDQDGFLDLRQDARADVVLKYDLHRVCLPQQIALIETMHEDAVRRTRLPSTPFRHRESHSLPSRI